MPQLMPTPREVEVRSAVEQIAVCRTGKAVKRHFLSIFSISRISVCI